MSTSATTPGGRPATAPRRAIVQSTRPRRRHVSEGARRQGLLAVSVLECGHLADTNARERRAGRLACWDCYYGKPPDRMGAIILEELETR